MAISFFKKTYRLVGAYTIALVLTALPLWAERIVFSANSMTGTTSSSSDKTTLRGNAYVLTSSMEIAADSITLSGKDFRYIEADGNISGKNLDTKMEFTCGKLLYDRETKIATLRDGVHLDDTENNVSAQAEIIEYNQNTDIAIIQIDITLTQKDNVCKSVYAVYRKKAQMLELSGNSRITQGDDTFRAQEITLNLETQEITLDGRVKGSVVDNRSESTEESAAENEEGETTDESASDERETADENATKESDSTPPDSTSESEAEENSEHETSEGTARTNYERTDSSNTFAKAARATSTRERSSTEPMQLTRVQLAFAQGVAS